MIIEGNQQSAYYNTYERTKKETFEERLQRNYDLLHQKGAKIVDIKFLTTSEHGWSLSDGYGDGSTTTEYSAIICYIPNLKKQKESELARTDKLRTEENERLALEKEQAEKEEANKPIN